MVYSKLTVVNAQTGAKGDSDIGVDEKIFYGNVRRFTGAARHNFEAQFDDGFALLFPDEKVQVEWRETPWSKEELLS